MSHEPTLYDRVPYNCSAHAVTAPSHLALIAGLNGGPSPRLEGYRMLEIGCGDGSNLLPLAFYNPRCHFVGVDASRVQIDMGLAAAQKVGVTNLTLLVADVRELPDLGGSFDYVASHGVFSWVPEGARAAILTAAHDRLAEDGLAYVSYNVLPGWKIRGLVRELVMDAVKDVTEPRERAARAKAAAADLRAMILDVEHPYRALLKRELGYVVESDLPYVLHEYLSEENVPFYVRDFVALAARHGLRHMGDAIVRAVAASLPPAAKERLGEEGLWGVEGHHLSDVLTNRQFRASVLCRAVAPPRPRADASAVRGWFIGARLTSVSGEVRLDPGVEETFKGPNDAEITVKDPSLKAALWVLRERFPEHLSFDELTSDVLDLLRAKTKIAEPEPARIDKLARALFLLYQNNQVDLSVTRPLPRRSPVERPALTRLGRYELTRSPQLTTPLHVPIFLDEMERRVAERLDGETAVNDLVPAIALQAAAGDPPITLEGKPISDPLLLKPMIEVMVRRSVDKLAAWGLLDDAR